MILRIGLKPCTCVETLKQQLLQDVRLFTNRYAFSYEPYFLYYAFTLLAYLDKLPPFLPHTLLICYHLII